MKIKNLTNDLDSEVILSYVINKSREYILTHPEHEITQKQELKFNTLIARRIKHEPIAYITNNKEFYKYNFYINKNVHIPKPATEDLINVIKNKLPANFSGTITDIGTGSGCIAITLAHEFINAKIIATDISQNALNIAQRNAQSLNVKNRIKFLQGDLLLPLTKKTDIIVANLPYGWSKKWTNNKEVFFQPKISYETEEQGLKLINKLITDLPKHLNQKGQCFLEFDPRQTKKITQIAHNLNLNISIYKDTQNFNRIALITQN